MEPRYLLMLKHFIYDCVMLMTSARLKVPKDRGMAYSASCYSVRGNPALCWQRSGLVLGDVHPKAFLFGNGKFLGLIIRWKSKETIRSCTVLVVEPIIHLWWRPTVWMVAIVGISAECLCWLRFISLFSKYFPTLCTSNNIKCYFKCVSSIFDYHKEKSPPILRLHCVCVREALW